MLTQSKLKTFNLVKFNVDKKYRDGFEIMALILYAAKDGYVTKFSIARYTKTNYAHLRRYLQVLIKMHFIETYIVGGRVFYKTSVEGINFLRQYCVLLDLISNLQRISENVAVAEVQFMKYGMPHQLNCGGKGKREH